MSETPSVIAAEVEAAESDTQSPNIEYSEMESNPHDDNINHESASGAGGGGGGDNQEEELTSPEILAQQQQQKVQQGNLPKASMRVTVVSMTANVIGGGVLALPTGFAQSSLVVGMLLLFGNCCVTVLNLYFIIASASYCNEFDYGKLLKRGLNKYADLAAKISLIIFPFGALIAYVRITADAMPAVFKEFFGASGFITTEFCWVLIGSFTFFVLSCRRTLSEMFIGAIFALATIFFAILCVVVRFFDGKYALSGKPAGVDSDFRPAYLTLGMFRTIPLITFSLSVHNNAPHYYQELENRSPDKMMRAVYISHGVIISSYAIMAMFGLLTFGEHRIGKAKGNILDAYDQDDALFNVARLLMYIHFATVYPLLHAATRKGFNNLVFGPKWIPMRILVLETFCIVLVSAVIGGLVPNIDDVLSIIGSVCGSIVILIVPAYLYLTLVVWPTTDKNSWPLLKILAYVSIVYGIIVGILGLIVSIQTLGQGGEGDDVASSNNATDGNSSALFPTTTASMVTSVPLLDMIASWFKV